MRKDIYKLFFEFIRQLLEQINFLSNNIANKNINNLNLIDTYSNNDLFLNNASSINNNSLFISNIEEEFCERLINITKSFVSSDIDLSDLNSNLDSRNNIFNFSNGGKMNYEEKNNILTNFENIPKLNDNVDNVDNNKIIDYNNNEYNCIFRSNTNRKKIMIHPNEILDKIQNEDKKDRKVLHHYSNSLKVNSNLEKLEGKISNEDDNENIDTIRSLGIEKIKNCYIF
jgi:Asp-tRNA(Asn)/Glu-tRNA(Gln) amidotransferase C subunit